MLIKFANQVAKSINSQLNEQIVNHLAKPIFYTVFLSGVIISFKLLAFSDSVNATIRSILLSFMVLTWLFCLFPMFKQVCQVLGRNSHRFPMIQERTIPLFDLVGKILLVLIITYILLIIWGINPVGLLASAGVIGIAVGFAAKDTLANLFSGFFILVDSPYKYGDYINLESGERGKVTHVGMRSTRLLTRDDIEITIPNAVIANAKIINESGGHTKKSRIRVPVGVAYGSDLDQVLEILETVANDHPELCQQPDPRVRVRNFGDSSINIELLVWIEEAQDRGRLCHELLMNIYTQFKHHKVEIPYNKSDLYIKELPER